MLDPQEVNIVHFSTLIILISSVDDGPLMLKGRVFIYIIDK